MCYNKLVSLFVILSCVHIKDTALAREICGGNDVTDFPRIEARQLDGRWHTQAGLVSGTISNSIFFWQFQGQIEWILGWNTTTNSCSYRKFEDKQLQSLNNGPFSVCFTSRRLLPEPAATEGTEIIFFMPTKTLLVFYRCFGEIKPNEICSERPSVRVLTRTLKLSQKDRVHLRMFLRRYGISLKDLGFVNPNENKCQFPTQVDNRKQYRY